MANIFSTILLGRMSPYAENIIKLYQIGFTNINQQQIRFSLGSNQWKIAGCDIKVAHDKIARVKLYVAKRKCSIAIKLIRLTRLTVTNVGGQMKAARSLLRPFTINKEPRQGDAL